MIATQIAEYALGSYAGPIDNYWGPDSNAGLESLQGYYGVSKDGCAGPVTWGKIRSSVYSICSPGYSCTGPNYQIDLRRAQDYGYNGCWTSYTGNDPIGGPLLLVLSV